MTSIARSDEIEGFLDRISGSTSSGGNPRAKALVRRVVSDLFRTIEDLDVTQDEFWAAVSFLTAAGQAREVALLSPGLGFDHFLDLRLDEADREAGLAGGTPRTIEGPLYVAGAPRSSGFARLDDGKDPGALLVVEGRVLDVDGQAVAGATVEVWHADSKGNYSHFDPTQTPFNLRRSIVTDADGRYGFRSIMPSGYGCPPGGPTQTLLDSLGRHGKRPAHIHFFVSAAGYRHLTTQINIAGDPLLNEDFAFATRIGLVPELKRVDSAEEMQRRGMEAPFVAIGFDFVLQRPVPGAPETEVHRERAQG